MHKRWTRGQTTYILILWCRRSHCQEVLALSLHGVGVTRGHSTSQQLHARRQGAQGESMSRVQKGERAQRTLARVSDLSKANTVFPLPTKHARWLAITIRRFVHHTIRGDTTTTNLVLLPGAAQASMTSPGHVHPCMSASAVKQLALSCMDQAPSHAFKPRAQ